MKRKNIIFLNSILLIFFLIISSFIENEGFWNKALLQVIAGTSMFCIFYLTIYLNSYSKNSFLELYKNKRYNEILRVGLYGTFLGISYEFVGQFWFDLWYYPPLKVFPELIFTLFIGYFFFAIIVRELYLFFENKGFGLFMNLTLVTFILLILIEGINYFTHSWIYFPVNPILFTVGWYSLIITFYLIPRKINMFS